MKNRNNGRNRFPFWAVWFIALLCDISLLLQLPRARLRWPAVWIGHGIIIGYLFFVAFLYWRWSRMIGIAGTSGKTEDSQTHSSENGQNEDSAR